MALLIIEFGGPDNLILYCFSRGYYFEKAAVSGSRCCQLPGENISSTNVMKKNING